MSTLQQKLQTCVSMNMHWHGHILHTTLCVSGHWQGSHPCSLSTSHGLTASQSPFFWKHSTPEGFSNRAKNPSRHPCLHPRCTYLTQKYKTTGPDFLGKSCSNTLRSSWSQFKCPLRKTETNWLGLWGFLARGWLGVAVVRVQAGKNTVDSR